MSTKSKAFVRYRLIRHHIEASNFLYVVIVEVSKDSKRTFVFSDKHTREFLTLPEAREYIATLRTKQY